MSEVSLPRINHKKPSYPLRRVGAGVLAAGLALGGANVVSRAYETLKGHEVPQANLLPPDQLREYRAVPGDNPSIIAEKFQDNKDLRPLASEIQDQTGKHVNIGELIKIPISEINDPNAPK